MSTRQRSAYATCGAAARAAFLAATEWDGEPWDGDPDTKPKSLGVEHWKVLGAVVSLTATYSKLEEYVYTAEIAELTGMHVQNVRQRLRDLHRAEVIVYISGGGRGHKSYLALPEKGEPTGAHLSDGETGEREADGGSPFDSEKVSRFPEKGEPISPKSGRKGEPLQALLPRRNPEKISESAHAREGRDEEHASEDLLSATASTERETSRAALTEQTRRGPSRCAECGWEHSHAYGCSLDADPSPAPPRTLQPGQCMECEMYAGRHLEGCSLVPEAAA